MDDGVSATSALLHRFHFTNAGALPLPCDVLRAPLCHVHVPGVKRALQQEELDPAASSKRPVVGYLRGAPLPPAPPPSPRPPEEAPLRADRWGLHAYVGRGHFEEGGFGDGGAPAGGAKMACLRPAVGGNVPPPPPSSWSWPPPPRPPPRLPSPALDEGAEGDEPTEWADTVPQGLLRLYREPQPHHVHVRHLAIIPYQPLLFAVGGAEEPCGGGGGGGGSPARRWGGGDEPTAAAALAGLGNAPAPPDDLLAGSMG